jgi:hypothetical protein
MAGVFRRWRSTAADRIPKSVAPEAPTAVEMAAWIESRPAGRPA